MFFLVTWAAQFLVNRLFEMNASYGEVAGVMAILIVAKFATEIGDNLDLF